MANDLNKAQLIGRLGQDPEIRYMDSGDPVANLSLATGESWKNKQGKKQEKTEWHRIVIFGKLAEIAGKYLRKGSQVYIEGKLQTRKWQDSDGNDRYTTEIAINGFNGSMQMLGGKNDSSPAQNEPTSRREQTVNQGRQPTQNQQGGEFGGFDGDTPF